FLSVGGIGSGSGKRSLGIWEGTPGLGGLWVAWGENVHMDSTRSAVLLAHCSILSTSVLDRRSQRVRRRETKRITGKACERVPKEVSTYLLTYRQTALSSLSLSLWLIVESSI